MTTHFPAAILAVVLLSTTLDGQHAEMKARGALAMGFDQDATAHHFLILSSGGAIEVAVRDPNDAKDRQAIRAHLQAIAGQFANGDFGAPFATHAEVPPGVPVMQRLRSAIRYSYSETTDGARVDIVTRDADALAAVHEFLRYQIAEHHTGDPLTVRHF